MYKIENGNSTLYFTYEDDYENYLDYMENGLKVVRKSINGRVYYFNDGSRLIKLTSTKNPSEVHYVLHKRNNTTIHNPKLQAKYLKCID